MKRPNSAVVLVIVLLILGALVVRYIGSPAYSLAEISDELSALCGQYAEFSKRRAEETEWESFEQKAREITEPIVEDLKKKRPGDSYLRQLAVYDLPEAIASRGKIPVSDLEERLSWSDRLLPKPVVQAQAHRYRDGGVDWLVVALATINGALLVAIGYTLFWPVTKRFLLSKDMESTLQQLDKRIARDPQSLRYLAARARLLTEAGRHEDAIVDIDRILEQKQHGVNLDEWRQLREAVAKRRRQQTEASTTDSS